VYVNIGRGSNIGSYEYVALAAKIPTWVNLMAVII
jgi:hypothetical protein